MHHHVPFVCIISDDQSLINAFSRFGPYSSKSRRPDGFSPVSGRIQPFCGMSPRMEHSIWFQLYCVMSLQKHVLFERMPDGGGQSGRHGADGADERRRGYSPRARRRYAAVPRQISSRLLQPSGRRPVCSGANRWPLLLAHGAYGRFAGVHLHILDTRHTPEEEAGSW